MKDLGLKIKKWGHIGYDAKSSMYFIIAEEHPEAAELLAAHEVKQ